MSAGSLEHRITLQQKTTTNVRGSVRTSWLDVAVVWAMVVSQKGSETFEAARLRANETIRIKLRYRDDVTADWRVVWEGVSYYAKYVDKSQRRDGWLWITAEAHTVNA